MCVSARANAHADVCMSVCFLLFQFFCLHVNKFIRLPISLLQAVREMDTKNTVLPLLYRIPVLTSSHSFAQESLDARTNTHAHTTPAKRNAKRKVKKSQFPLSPLHTRVVSVQQVLAFGFAVLFIWLRFLYLNLSCLPAFSDVLYIALFFNLSLQCVATTVRTPFRCSTRNFRSCLKRFHFCSGGILRPWNFVYKP